MKLKKIWTLALAVAIGMQPLSYAALPSQPAKATEAEKSNVENDAQKAVAEFKMLSKQEKKARFKEVKKALKDYRANKHSMAADANDNQILAIIFAILIPPLGVFIHQGEINTKFWISLGLTLLFFIPGVIYSLLVVTGNA